MTKEQLQWAMYEAYATQLLNRIEAQEAEIAKLGTMAEQTRADAVTRAAADEKRIAALRHECERWKTAYSDHCALLDVIHASLGINKGDNVIGEIDRIHKARNGLLTQVQDLRAALAKEQELHAATEATHDTPEGLSVAESVIRGDRNTEPTPGELWAGDVVEVFQKTTSETLADDIAITGTVFEILWSGAGTKCVRLIPETMNRRSSGGDYFGYCDVRKVTT